MAKRPKSVGDAVAAPGAPPAPASGPASDDAPAAYAPLLKAGVQATADRVQEMHQAIAGQAFGGLHAFPGLTVPTRIVQGLHDAIAQGVYAAVRHGSGAALTLAAGAERLIADPRRSPSSKERTLRSVLNGAFGDTLAAAGNALAMPMGLHARGAPLALTVEGLSALGPRVALFVHGLACDERSWDLRGEAWADTAWSRLLPAQQPVQYGALLERELGISPIFLRYNTGLSIETNARELAALLARAAHAAPQVDEWLLVGHSMGGLVARRAHDIATAEQFNWAPHAPLVVCLGSPHQGARLEQLGHLAARALDSTAVTRPLGRAANARSRGIKDLRSGIRRPAAPTKKAALRLVYGTLGDASGGAIGPLLGRWLGDGLVLPASAGDAGQAGDVERVELAGLGHMQLLNHPRVYAKLRRWFGAD